MSTEYQLEGDETMRWNVIAAVDRSSTERAGYRRLEAKYSGACDSCAGSVAKGETILYNRRHELRLLCLACGARADAGENLEHNAPPRMTHRERLEAKAEKRHEWAEGRTEKAATSYAAGSQALDAIPFGQPVHGLRDRNYRDKATAKLERSWEHSKMAEHHEQAAAGLERQLRTSIYDDDLDAVQRLEEKIGRLEAERGRIKAYNATARKGAPDLELLDERQRANLALSIRVAPYAVKNGAFPGYGLTNLSANINRLRKRLEGLRRQEA